MIPSINLKRISPPQGVKFHAVKIGNYFTHMIETSRLLQKISETHVKVIQGEDKGHTFSYYGGYTGIEYIPA